MRRCARRGFHSFRRPARGNEIPLVGLARLHPVRKFLLELGQRLPFPVTKGNFDEAVVGAIGLGIEPHRAAHQFHCLARAPERACYIIEIRGLIPQEAGEKQTIADRLLAAEIIERNVFLALKPAYRIPVRLSVPDHIDEQGDTPVSSIPGCRQSLTTEMSGASTAFMPMVW